MSINKLSLIKYLKLRKVSPSPCNVGFPLHFKTVKHEKRHFSSSTKPCK